MRKILVAVFLLVALVSFGQQTFPTVGLIQFPKTNGIGYRGVGGDSLLWVPSDTIRPAASIVGKAHIAIKNGVLYYWDGSKWSAFSGGGGGSGTVTSVATGYGLSGGTITTTGTLRWDSATGYITGLRRKDSATGTNLNGYLTRTSVRTYSPGIDDVLAIGQKLTANRTIDLNGGWIYKISDGSYYQSWDSYDWLLHMRAGRTFDIQIPNGSDLTQFQTTDGNIFGYTSNVSTGTTSQFRSNQDLTEIIATKTAVGGNDQASARADASGSSLYAGLVMHPVSSINHGFMVDRNSRMEYMGMASGINNNFFRGVRVDSFARVLFDTIYHSPRTDLAVILYDSVTNYTYSTPMSSFGGGSTPTFQQVLTAGSTLTGDNTIAGGGHSLTFDNNNTVTINAVSGAVTNSLIVNGAVVGINATNGSASYSEIAMSPTAITINPNLGALAIDTLAAGGAFTDSFMVWRTDGYVKKLDGNKVVSTTGTQTLTNKRWTPRVGSTTSSATPTINTDNVDIYKLTAVATNITSMTSSLSGTPNDGDVLEVQFTGTGSYSLAWGTSFVSSTVTLPTAITTATLTVILQYYTTSSYGNNKWVCVNYY